jgi:hypothetical protein
MNEFREHFDFNRPDITTFWDCVHPEFPVILSYMINLVGLQVCWDLVPD